MNFSLALGSWFYFSATIPGYLCIIGGIIGLLAFFFLLMYLTDAKGIKG